MFASLCSLAAVIALAEARADSRDVYYTGKLGSEKPLKWKRTVQHAKRRGSTLGMDDEAVATRHYTVSFARSATPASKKDLQDALAEAGVGADVKFVPNRSYRVYCSLMQLHVATEKKGWVVDAVRLLQDRHKLDMERLKSDERMSRVSRYLVHTSHDPEKRLFETGRFREGDDRYEEELIKEWKAILQLRGLKAAWEKVGPTRYLMVLGSASEIEERRNVLRAVASSHSVAWMEAAPEYKVLNDVATSLVQSDQQGAHPLWENSFGRLAGANQLAMIGDTGLRLDSCFFRDQTRDIAFWPKIDRQHRKIISYRQCTDNGNVDSTDGMGHGSHVAGSLAGLPENQFQQYKGLVPDAKIFFYDMQCDGTSGLIFPYDLRVYFETGIAVGAGVSHNSWGNTEKPAQVITMDAEADSTLFEHSSFVIVFAAGNNANAGVLSPAAAKNVIAVGAHMSDYREEVRHNVASFSARGPTFDNRIKPEIMAPGQTITSAHNTESCGVTDKRGTSMAAPFVSGSALLLKQYLEEGWYPSGRRDNPSLYPANSLIKAMLIHSTRRLRGTQSGLFVGKDIPNKYQGWGSVALQDIVYFAEKVGTEEELTFAKTHVHLVNNHSIGQDEVFVIDFHADEPSRETRAAGVRATLVWTDPPASEGSMKALVNDLDLSLMLPDGSVLNSGRQNSYDRLNVVEQIDLPSAAPGWYRAYVYGYHVVETHPYPKLPFSVVITAPSIDVSSDPSKKPQCPGSPVCGGQRGKCNSQGLCECAPEFHHIDCGLCDAEVNCNNHGTCTPNTGACSCTGNWQGDHCELCKVGWYGEDCDIDCTCSHHGSCDASLPEEERTCRCEGNWDGENCQYCANGYVNHDRNDCTETAHWCEDRGLVEVTDEETGFIMLNSWNSYKNSLHCEWRIKARNEQQKVVLELISVNIEKSYDWLRIYNRDMEYGDRLFGFEGTGGTGRTIVVPSDLAYVSFESDLIGPGSGFLIRFSTQGECQAGDCANGGSCVTEGKATRFCQCDSFFDPNTYCTRCLPGYVGTMEGCTRGTSPPPLKEIPTRHPPSESTSLPPSTTAPHLPDPVSPATPIPTLPPTPHPVRATGAPRTPAPPSDCVPVPSHPELVCIHGTCSETLDGCSCADGYTGAVCQVPEARALFGASTTVPVRIAPNYATLGVTGRSYSAQHFEVQFTVLPSGSPDTRDWSATIKLWDNAAYVGLDAFVVEKKTVAQVPGSEDDMLSVCLSATTNASSSLFVGVQLLHNKGMAAASADAPLVVGHVEVEQVAVPTGWCYWSIKPVVIARPSAGGDELPPATGAEVLVPLAVGVGVGAVVAISIAVAYHRLRSAVKV